MSDRVPIPKHPGYWRRGDRVVFKYRDHRRKQRWGGAPTIAAAKKLRAQLETDVARGEYRSRSSDTFAEYARACIATYRGRTSKPIEEETRTDYLDELERYAIPFLGEMRLTEIEAQDIKEFAAHVAATGVKPNTIRLALAPVKVVFATAFEDGKIRVNPAAGVRIAVPRDVAEEDEDEGPDRKALTEEQLRAVLLEIPERWLLFFRVLVSLGLRISEMIELRWRDVDLGERKVRIRRKFYRGVGRPKSKYGRRTLKLTPELATSLWTLRKDTRAGDDDLVFTSAEGARVDGSNLMARALKPAAVRAGVGEWVEVRAGVGEWVEVRGKPHAETWVGFHTFRHTCATLLFKEGWNPKQVQVWLGHHSPAFTLATYVHLLDEDLPEPIELAPGTSGGTQSLRDDPNSDPAAAEVPWLETADSPASASGREAWAGDF